MRKWIIDIAYVAAGVLALAGTPAAAQSLPALPKASEITTGKLPDGIYYYLVKNQDTPGFADFALVQPRRSDRMGPREDLVKAAHFPGRKPYEFLASWGVGYSEKGYIQHLRDATVFRFQDVPVSYPEASDSTLLLLFDLARSSQYEQALVVSGNIDVAAITERIRMLSMTLSQRMPDPDSWNYAWKPQEQAEVTTGTAPVGTIVLRYRSPRTDRSLMNTIQPVMSRILASELEIILKRRMRSAFNAAGIPLASCRCHYIGSDQTVGDELFSVFVDTDPGKLTEAVEVCAGVLSSLDSDGATTQEVSFARSILSTTAQREAILSRMDNAQYVEKCIAAYLYGANLASAATLSSSFTGKKLDVERERELLNRYISALLSRDRNLHLHVCAPIKPDDDLIGNYFSKGWDAGSLAAADIPVPEDTLKLMTSRRKVKLKTATADPFSGGKLWTFSNGVSVLFKKTSDKGAFHYGYLVKGGWNEIPQIHGSEPAFASEVMGTSRVAGMSSEHLKDLLAMYGASLDGAISLSDIRVSGTAPKSSLSLVLKTMLSLACSVHADPVAYGRYKEEKQLRLVRDKFSEEGTRAVLDSIMCPGYSFAAGSLPALPDDSFPSRVEQYMGKKGADMRNGIIVLIGDLDEAATQKLLIHTLGEFKSGQQRTSRPRLQYPLRECWSTSFVRRNWRSTGINVSLSAMRPFGSDTNLQLQLAGKILEEALTEALASQGFRCRVEAVAELLPAEKGSMYISCTPCPLSGIPSEVSVATPAQGLATVRRVLNSLASEDVNASMLERSKTKLINSYSSFSGSTDKLMQMILERNALGRDVNANYSSGIKAVKAADIRELFASLSECTCEYVVQ